MSSPAVVITLVAILSAVCGVWLPSVPALSRRMVPFSGGVLMGIALFWILPEMAEFFHWPGALILILGGFLLLWVIDRFVYPVCPACSHTHEHEHCATELHGFALPLLGAAAVHSALDGWTVSAGFGPVLVLGLAVHKIPEGIALGVIARASLSNPVIALAWCALAESSTLVGAGLETWFAPNPYTIHILLALAGGGFLYLGGHAVHGELRRSGRAFVPALTGVAGSTLLRLLAG